MSHRDSVRLRHMLDHAREAVAMTAGKTRADLDVDRKLNLALVRLLEIVGEAEGRITEEDRRRCPGIPWSAIIGLRNRAHPRIRCGGLRRAVILTADLPRLIAELESCLAET